MAQHKMSISKHCKLVSIALLMNAAPAIAADWYFIGHADSTSFFVEKSSIKNNNNIKSCWTSHVYQRQKNGLDQSTNHMLVDCRAKTIGQDKWIGYTKNGDVVDSVVVIPSFEEASPDSMADKIVTAVCSGKFYGKPQKTLDVDAIRHVIGQMTSNQ